jgi:polysaccharide export outer membrane protein
MFRTRLVWFLASALLIVSARGLLADGSKLAVGDIISVVVEDEKDFTKQYQINSDGCVAMPMIAPVEIAGMNVSDAASAISKALLEVIVNPRVSMSFVERGKMQVFVVGQVKTPGPISVGIGDRVIQALAAANYDDTSDLSHISLRRGNEATDLDLTKYLKGQDLSVNVELQTGDTIVVPQLDAAGTVMLLGQVSKTGKFPLKPNMTFREVMGLVGGVTLDADTEKITVKREGALEPMKIDYTLAMAGDPNADLTLQGGDTIYIPQLETATFTVMGGVNRPGPYPLKGKVTLSQAIGMAGGATPDRGNLAKVSITRSPEADKPGQIMNVDVKQVISKAQEDPVIRRGDLIYVAEKKPKANILQVLQMLLPFGWLLR